MKKDQKVAFKREKPDQSLGSGVRPARERPCRRRSLSFSFLFVSFCFICAVPPRLLCLSFGAATNRHRWLGGWSKGAIDGRLRVRWSGLHVQVLAPGDGGYPRSVVVGFFSEGGGLLRSTVADFSFREGETHLAPPSPAFGHGEWRLAKLRAAVFGFLSLFRVFSFLFGFWVGLVVMLAFAVVFVSSGWALRRRWCSPIKRTRAREERWVWFRDRDGRDGVLGPVWSGEDAKLVWPCRWLRRGILLLGFPFGSGCRPIRVIVEIWPVYFGLFVFFLVLVTLSLSLTFFQIKSLDGEKKARL